MEKRDIWPSMLFLFWVTTESITLSYTLSSTDLLRPKESNAPAFIMLSTALLFISEKSTLSQKSVKHLKLPFFFLEFIMERTAPLPTFLIAASPNLILFPATEKFT